MVHRTSFPARHARYVAVEIERKFLISRAPDWLDRCDSERVEQGYLAVGEDGSEVRVRRIGDRTVLTAKRGRGERRLEEEIEIDAEQFAALWPLTEGRRLQKMRHYVTDGYRVEVDVYSDELEGLIVAEVEFDSEAASAEFEPPDWLGEELTGDVRYANEHLATYGAPTRDA
jgi:adenylate cyclase